MYLDTSSSISPFLRSQRCSWQFSQPQTSQDVLHSMTYASHDLFIHYTSNFSKDARKKQPHSQAGCTCGKGSYATEHRTVTPLLAISWPLEGPDAHAAATGGGSGATGLQNSSLPQCRRDQVLECAVINANTHGTMTQDLPESKSIRTPCAMPHATWEISAFWKRSCPLQVTHIPSMRLASAGCHETLMNPDHVDMSVLENSLQLYGNWLVLSLHPRMRALTHRSFMPAGMHRR